MRIDTHTPLGDDERRALERALEEAGVGVQEQPQPYGSAWRQTAAREAIDGEPLDGYAPSPRSTRGATRA